MDFGFRAAVEQARKCDDLYFSALLSKDRIDAAIRDANGWFQAWVYTGSVTMWVFLSQCLSADHSCTESVAGLTAWFVRIGDGSTFTMADTEASQKE